MTITNIEGSESESNRYYDLPDQKPSLNTENEEYFEDSLLLGRGRRTTPAPAICRSRSVSSSRLISESSGLSIWTLSRLQKIVLVITAIVDLLTFLSVSIMAPFFPEEVGQPFININMMHYVLLYWVKYILHCLLHYSVFDHQVPRLTYIQGYSAKFLFYSNTRYTCTIIFLNLHINSLSSANQYISIINRDIFTC